jgi:hypothetical protein
VQGHGGEDIITRNGNNGVQDLSFAHIAGRNKDKIEDPAVAAIFNLPWPQ